MTILQDMDAEFLAHARPLPEGSTWLIGGNVWHALLADWFKRNDEAGGLLEGVRATPTMLFGLPVKRVQRMSGWGLAVALDHGPMSHLDVALEELTPHEIHG